MTCSGSEFSIFDTVKVVSKLEIGGVSFSGLGLSGLSGLFLGVFLFGGVVGMWFGSFWTGFGRESRSSFRIAVEILEFWSFSVPRACRLKSGDL